VVAGQGLQRDDLAGAQGFFGHLPFPAMHVDTGKKFPEMYAFRDRYAREWNLDLIMEECPPLEAIDPTLPPARPLRRALRPKG